MGTNKNKLKIICTWIAGSYEWLHHLPVLKKLGHEVRFLPYMFGQEDMQPIDAQLIDAIEIHHPDLLIVNLYRNALRKETIRHISEDTGTTTLGLFGDDEKYFDGLVGNSMTPTVEWAPCFNKVLTRYLPAIPKYKRIGIDPIYEKWGANNVLFKRLKVKQDLDVTFCGGLRKSRLKFMEDMMMRGMKIRVYGTGWDTRELTDKDYVKLINQTKINLGISEDDCGGKNIKQIKGRDVEVPMCGGFLLTGDNEYLSEYYKVGKEIESYRNPDECADKITFYLKNDSKREKISRAGYKRAQRDHTYDRQWKRILDKIELKGKQNG